MQRLLLGDRYTLVELLGDGGMAEVYLAHDNSLDRRVALKVLRERYADDGEFVERFRREALNAAALNHPGIVQVYDRGRTEDGALYMAMEYVPGGTLKERMVAEGSLVPREAADLASQVAEALAVAHDRGIVHRDVKPQNVLLASSGEAKVSDFGIARAASSETMTQANAVLGTLAYMSPEQVRGERVSPASDLYSLGVLLYEMLTGELPYRGDDPIATAMKRLDEEPPHPRETNPNVPEALDALVVRLLARDPEDRPASAASLSEDLRRLRDGLPPLADVSGNAATRRATLRTEHVHSPPTLSGGRGSGPSAGRGRRRTLAVPLVALLVGAVLIGGLVWALGRTAPDRAAPEAVARKVEVPLLVGLPPDEAQKRLEKVGLDLGSRDEAPSGTIAEGAVSEQDPAAGTTAEQGRAVNVVLSTGQPREPASGGSPSATPTATPSATASPDAASPEARKAAEEAAKEDQKRREEARKQAQERREEAREKAQERREERAKEGGG
ncbi:MAG TPA: Stk1 family PASTA domain-containing Ser/Thr kinase [Rubrobacter sp.]|nr:Stk1 family PASTA domain-containing Ser/Thr kinase [Rubrobacter sp.]